MKQLSGASGTVVIVPPSPATIGSLLLHEQREPLVLEPDDLNTALADIAGGRYPAVEYVVVVDGGMILEGPIVETLIAAMNGYDVNVVGCYVRDSSGQVVPTCLGESGDPITPGNAVSQPALLDIVHRIRAASGAFALRAGASRGSASPPFGTSVESVALAVTAAAGGGILFPLLVRQSDDRRLA